MLDLRARHLVARILGPVARRAVRLGITPTVVTVGGVLVTVAGAVLVGTGRLQAGALVVLGGSALDALDGAVARAAGEDSARGGVIDSLADRVGETAMWAGLGFHLAGDPIAVVLVVISLGASFSISYLRSKAEALDLFGRSGLMGRPERVLLYVAGLLSGLVVPMLWAMAALTVLTAGQRLRSVWSQLPE